MVLECVWEEEKGSNRVAFEIPKNSRIPTGMYRKPWKAN